MKICIDNREYLRIPTFQEYIKSGKTTFIDEIELGNYQCGDVFTQDGNIGIERKGEDLVSSIYNEQLSKQCKELSDNFSYPFLFIEYDGIIDAISKNLGTNPEIIIGALASVSARYKVSIIFVGDFYVSFVCKLIEKFYDSHNITKDTNYVPIRRGATVGETKLDIISRIPKIGPKKGTKLLEHYNNSIKAISNTTEEEIMKIPGFGPKLAKESVEIFK
jgi:ERCC4-type nuclease